MNKKNPMPVEWKKKLNTIMKKYAKELTPEDQSKFKKMMREVLFEGKTAVQACEFIDESQIELVYEIAYNLYNAGDFEEANRIFRLLALMDPSQIKVWHGIAACYQQMEDFQKAIENYFVWAYLEPEDPIPLYFISDCYIKLGLPKPAVYTLIMCMDRCGENPTYEQMKEKAKHTRDKLMQDVGWEFKEAA